MTIRNPAIFAQFTAAWGRNTHGGWAARWQRRRIAPALAIQRLGLNWRANAILFWGDRMQVLTGETVSRDLLAFGYAEPALTALLCDLITTGASAVDIGTHFGYEALLMARLCGSKGSIHAFEPNPEVFSFAARNLGTSPGVVLHQAALSDHAGRATFPLPSLAASAFGRLGAAAHASQNLSVDVDLQTLDHALEQRTQPVAFLKCDAEGHEAAILRGAMTVLAKDLPALVLETDMPGADGRSAPMASYLAAQLAPLGYRALSFDFDGALCVGPLDSIAVGHANTLYLPVTHPRFSAYTAGCKFSTS